MADCTVTLPDGKTRRYPCGTSLLAIAADISPTLAQKALLGRIDGVPKDLSTALERDGRLEILTKAQQDDPDLLEVLRHSCAHVLAQAAKELWGKAVQITIGPATDDGFYYDFAADRPFVEDDLHRLEARMRLIVARNLPIERISWDRAAARAFFIDQGEHYKVEILEALGADVPLSFYRQGDFVDLCRGPHLPSTGKVGKAFKLQKLAGAYWRGDPKNPMLQRVYGTAWVTDDQLAAYLYRIEEAHKRDHRRLGVRMGLFHQQEEAAGQVFWHYPGYRLYEKLSAYIGRRIHACGYQSVKTPLLLERKLWELSGHWEKYRANMFLVHAEDETERQYALKPMNCPGHIAIFNQGIKSYRDLPLRLSEFGACHRYEPSGALHGLMRVRGFVQDDGHIFCTEDQILSETGAFCALLQSVYRDLGFDRFTVKLSSRPPLRAGDDALWDKAEAALQAAIEQAAIPWRLNPGEGAFYGPKLEFVLTDALGRDWQCGTLQLDFVLPARLNAHYIDPQGQKQTPVMLHRAILGSLERFIAILLEHYAGRLPLWLAPTVAVVASITEDQADYAAEIAARLQKKGLEVEQDIKNEKISYKVRFHSERKVPFLLIVGEREKASRTVSLRRFGDQGGETLSLEALEALLIQQSLPPA